MNPSTTSFLPQTSFDATINDSGRIALWTADDNVTRFDRLTIKPLP